ncbi:Gfo/Idh/MocA family protein [Microbacterium sp. SLBN-146]|uniref:Gfo/Idh/MocA family protein n=1 Tax=Microbacterium sp. SLBN-146 TaxID=2768457 RepID=UPI00116855D2|nr:Gfo/Idh/MocA family oxidoreductase [Microbacterium sp. SLBN-146]TQJ30711.1 putative dehydrogenase [Microbacterium sp. SLBN-146]
MTDSPRDRPLRVAMIGHGFMGAAHSQGWRVAPRFFELALTPRMQVVAGRDEAAVERAAAKWGWAESSGDWREVIERDDIDVVDIVTTGDSHAEIAVAALEAGKHVLCEKPLANTVAEAEVMAAAATAAAERGVRSMVGFTYRRAPAATFARDLIGAGRIGEIRQVRAAYRQDWLRDESGPMTWRLEKDRAGSGALGDIGAHAIDLAEYMTGLRLDGVSGTIDTIVTERPLLGEKVGLSGTASNELGRVTVDDIAVFTGRFAVESGFRPIGTFEATRFATGRKNALTIEISGSRGAIAFDLERLNELEIFDANDPELEQGFRRVLVTEPGHPYLAPWWPAGHMLGYEHGFSHQVVDFVSAISEGVAPTPSFSDGLHLQRVLDAVERSSAADARWTPVG